jgi:hypothetical protein
MQPQAADMVHNQTGYKITTKPVLANATNQAGGCHDEADAEWIVI